MGNCGPIRKMKLLFLTPRLPYPPTRGDKLHIFNLIKTLSRSHEIVLLSFIQSKRELDYVPQLQKYCVEVRCISLPVWKSVLRCVGHLWSGLPLQVAYFMTRRMHGELALMLQRHTFDVVHTHLIRMAQYTAPLDTLPRVLDLTDAVSLYLSRFLTTESNRLKKFMLKRELSRIRIYENILSRFDRSLVCSAVDQQALLTAVPSARIDIVENGVDLASPSGRKQEGTEERTLIFAGNMSYFPNHDGLRYFVGEILPLVRQRVPEVRLLIVGQKPPADFRRLNSDHITVTGYVPDMNPYYLRSTVAISPVRFGAGTPYKVLEAMTLGIPVVATAIGTEGLQARSGEHLLVATTTKEFADHVVSLLSDDKMRNRLSTNARELVARLYDCTVVAAKLERVYEDVISRRRSPGGTRSDNDALTD